MIKLYEYGPTRSVRVRWTLLELGLDFESVADRELIGTTELRRIHPQAKLPAIEIDGRPLFESAAICEYLCDLHSEAGLIAPTGTYERGLHAQWASFVLTEIEAWLWSTAKHTWFYPEAERLPDIAGPNGREVRAGLAVFEQVFEAKEWLIGDAFSVTDIIVAYTLNWAHRSDQLGDFPACERFLARCRKRRHCALPD